VKPVAGRIKQRSVGTETQTHFSGHRASLSVQGTLKARVSSPTTSEASIPVKVSTETHEPERKKFLLPRYKARAHPSKIVRRRLIRRTLLLRGVAASFLVIAIMASLVIWNGYVKLHKVFHGTSTVAALGIKPMVPSMLAGEGDSRVNILLLGIGGPGQNNPDLTNAIMLLSIDPVNDTATMLSIPQDLWVDQPISYFGRQQEINVAYESGKYRYLGQEDSGNADPAAIEAGLSNLDQVVESVTGINIDYHLLVNLQAFKQVIDTVGGITVDVPSELNDATMAWENNNNPVLASAGTQHMDGTEALLYAQSLETTSNSARDTRQRQILLSLKDQILTAGTLSDPAKIEGLINTLGNNAYSDLSPQGAERISTLIKKIGDNRIASIDLTDPAPQLVTGDHVDGLSVEEPAAGFNDYNNIRSYVRSQLPDGYIVKEDAPITVLAKTAAGASITGSLLQSYGYNVTTTAMTNESVSRLTLVDLSKGNDPFTLHYLESHYGVKAIDELPAGITVPPGGAKFVIIEP
jgi:LCP family protein required for cell wall assembly